MSIITLCPLLTLTTVDFSGGKEGVGSNEEVGVNEGGGGVEEGVEEVGDKEGGGGNEMATEVVKGGEGGGDVEKEGDGKEVGDTPSSKKAKKRNSASVGGTGRSTRSRKV